MTMEEVFQKLRDLQDVLSKKIDIERDLSEIPHGLSTQEELLSRLRKAYNERNGEHDAAKAELNLLKESLLSAGSSREHAEKSMDGINTQREYEALDKEIRDATDKEQQFRKDIQKAEKNIQDIDDGLKRDQGMIEQIEDEVKEKRAFIETKSSEKREELKALTKEEEAITPGLDPETVFKFERIIRSKQGLGIVAVKNGVCTGCHMILPAQFVNEVHQGDAIIYCPYCSRILFYQESEEGEETYITDSETGGLSDLDDFGDEEEEDEDYDEDEDNEKEGMDFEEE
jgi:predicted  nucleic acid-binding Zn-ribbon protein